MSKERIGVVVVVVSVLSLKVRVAMRPSDLHAKSFPHLGTGGEGGGGGVDGTPP